MKKKLIGMVAVAAAMLTTGCSNDITDNSGVDNTGKEKILFSAGDDQPVVRSRAGFANSTRIVARIVSESRGSEAAKCVKTVLSATEQVTSKDYSDVAYASDDYVRYWDDAHGRNSKLSVYAVAIPNRESYTEESVTKCYIDESKLSGGNTWGTDNTGANSIVWTVSATQTTDILANEDLAYSNNIQEGNVGGNSVYTWDYENGKYPEKGEANATKHTYGTDPVVTDGRLYFTQSSNESELASAPSTAAGHFDRGQMEFKHSLSRLQINLIKGSGYESPAPFAMTGSIKVNKMPYTGTFNIKTATWSSTSPKDVITMAKWETAATSKDATYEAQVVPGYEFTNSDAVNALEFTIDGNTYYITNKMLFTALGEQGKVMLQGNRYIFDITVAKAKIQNVTATIVPWNEVTAANTEVDNSHYTFSFYNNNNKCTDVKLYKNMQSLGDGVIATGGTYSAAPVAGAAYTNVALVGTEAPYSTNEYYNDNNTAYHFRSLNTVSENKLNSDKTAFTMTSGNDDYHWGAPMLPTTLTAIPYNSENGYSATIAKGIVAADKNSNIVLTEIHMMSQLVVKLTTPTTGGVDLTDAEVYLTKYSNTGSVDMSLGKITPTTTITDKSSKFAAAASPATNTYVFNVVPQDLKRGTGANDSDYIGITIKTKDNNEYYIVKRLSEIIATSVGSEVTNLQTKDSKITTWYPGHRYTYTFNIKKKEIEIITATIVNWNDVIGANTDLDLEK